MIAEKLEKVAAGEIRRLMIFLPPRHSKSTISSRYFPAWYLGRYPDRQIISASYNADLAGDFGREVRNIVASPEYRTLFNTRLASDSQAANRWHTEQKGSYVAAGVGTSITGRGAHVAIIDDPHKDRIEADSKMMRERIWGWYKSVFYTRLQPGGCIVYVGTRWNEDDLAGRLLQAQDEGGDVWEVIRLPAIAEANDPIGRNPGDALWPESFPVEALDRIRRVLIGKGGPREWQSLYQQDPMPESGEYFTKEMIRHYITAPKNLRIYGASDYAVSSDGNYTVHGIAGVDNQDNLYVLDWWRGRTSPDIWIDIFLDLIKRWQPIAWAEERGQILKSIGPFIEKRMREQRIYCHRRPFTPSTDKRSRARSILGRMSMRRVFFPQNASWTGDLVSELLKFDAGTHDDQVDVMSLFGMMLPEMQKSTTHYEPEQDSSLTFKYLMGRARERRNGIVSTSESFVVKKTPTFAEEEEEAI